MSSGLPRRWIPVCVKKTRQIKIRSEAERLRPPADRSIVRLEVGGRGRSVDRAHQLRSGGDVRRPFIADRGRPGPVDTVGPDGIDGKIGFCATLSSPQRQRAFPPQPVLIDHPRKTPLRSLPRRHDHLRARAVILQGFRALRQCDNSTAGHLNHAARVVA